MNVGAVRYSKVSPSFLSANSTSHTWPFSAIAELIDNAYDPDVAASQIDIEIRTIQNEKCLVFVDNGNGMNPDALYKMLSFGFSDKPEVQGHLPIGHYGNGFKSGSMRLGKDAIVFTCKGNVASVGLLSQTYLEAVKVETVLVPIMSWSLPDFKLIPQRGGEHRVNLEHMTRYTLFKSSQCLQAEIEEISRTKHSGTKIIIYNLKRDSRGNHELDTQSTTDDILNPETVELDRSNMIRPVAEVIPTYRKSLKSYCSILYLKPRIKIYLRGHKIKTTLVAKSLMQTEYDSYKPSWACEPIKLTLGFSCSVNKEDYGTMLYHRNRLIQAYQRIGFQKQPNEAGAGVVVVVEANFLLPIHNKQDFHKTEKYNAFMNSLAQKLNLYYNVKTNPEGADSNVKIKTPWNWAQCDQCLKWRRLMDIVDEKNLPDKWYCHLNSDATHNRCDIPEEPEDEDDVLQNRSSYSKKYKRQQEDLKRRTKEAEMLRKEEKEADFRRREAMLVEREKQHVGGIDLVKAREALDVAKLKDKQQAKLINQLKEQRDNLERQKQDMVQMAGNLAMHSIEGRDDVHGARTDQQKRKSSEQGPHATKKKAMRVTMDDGEVVVVTENADDPGPVIDLTNDDDASHAGSSIPRLGKKSGDTGGREGRTVKYAPSSKSEARASNDSRRPFLHIKPRKTLDKSAVRETTLVVGGKTPVGKSPRGVRKAERHGDKMVVDLFNKKKPEDVKPNVEELNTRMGIDGEGSAVGVNDGVTTEGRQDSAVREKAVESAALEDGVTVKMTAEDGASTSGESALVVAMAGDNEIAATTRNLMDVVLEATERENDLPDGAAGCQSPGADADSMRCQNDDDRRFSRTHSKSPIVSERSDEVATQTDASIFSGSSNDELLEQLNRRDKKIEQMKRDLNSLRNDIVHLLHIIVPDVVIENLNKVDAYVREIIHVNEETEANVTDTKIGGVKEER